MREEKARFVRNCRRGEREREKKKCFSSRITCREKKEDSCRELLIREEGRRLSSPPGKERKSLVRTAGKGPADIWSKNLRRRKKKGLAIPHLWSEKGGKKNGAGFPPSRIELDCKRGRKEEKGRVWFLLSQGG